MDNIAPLPHVKLLVVLRTSIGSDMVIPTIIVMILAFNNAFISEIYLGLLFDGPIPCCTISTKGNDLEEVYGAMKGAPTPTHARVTFALVPVYPGGKLPEWKDVRMTFAQVPTPRLGGVDKWMMVTMLG